MFDVAIVLCNIEMSTSVPLHTIGHGHLVTLVGGTWMEYFKLQMYFLSETTRFISH